MMPTELRYAPRIPWLRRRRAVRAAIALSIFVAVVLGTFSFHSAWKHYQVRRAGQLRRQQDMAAWEQANRYTAGATDIVWEEDLTGAAELLKNGATFTSNGVGVLRKPLVEQTQLLARVGANQDANSPTLFLHERANHAKVGWPAERQALLIQLESTRAGYNNPHNLWTFRVVGILPAWTGELGVREARITVSVPEHLNDPAQRTRFYAGQPDPNDPSHFTIGYAVNDQPGTIDGWLHSGSIVELKVRDGPATQPVKMKHVVRAGASSR